LCEDFDSKKDMYLGRDEYGRMGYFKSEQNLIGKFVQVKITQANGVSLYGDVVSCD
jgi:tRNA A37 methylthiotransferase MiaB